MTTEIRSQLNVRIDPDVNLSISVATFVDDDQEAHDAGARQSRMVSAYLAGYNLTQEEKPE